MINYDKLFENLETQNISNLTYVDELKSKKISISTITINCNIGTNVFVETIYKYCKLDIENILSITYGDRKTALSGKTILSNKKKTNKKKKFFYNQITIQTNHLEQRINKKKKEKPINIKIFKNGNLHLTGCRHIEDFKFAIKKLLPVLIKGQDEIIGNKEEHIEFVSNVSDITLCNFKVRMINSNYKLDFEIDRNRLINIVKQQSTLSNFINDFGFIKCMSEATGRHSCVNLSYYFDKEINNKNKSSIFIFRTGSVVITGSKSYEQIIICHNFVEKLISNYYNEIKKIKIEDIEKSLRKYNVRFPPKQSPNQIKIVQKNIFPSKKIN